MPIFQLSFFRIVPQFYLPTPFIEVLFPDVIFITFCSCFMGATSPYHSETIIFFFFKFRFCIVLFSVLFLYSPIFFSCLFVWSLSLMLETFFNYLVFLYSPFLDKTEAIKLEALFLKQGFSVGRHYWSELTFTEDSQQLVSLVG